MVHGRRTLTDDDDQGQIDRQVTQQVPNLSDLVAWALPCLGLMYGWAKYALDLRRASPFEPSDGFQYQPVGR
jgi:hypothetical protein